MITIYEAVTKKPRVSMLVTILIFKMPGDANAKTQTYARKFTEKLKSPTHIQQRQSHHCAYG